MTLRVAPSLVRPGAVMLRNQTKEDKMSEKTETEPTLFPALAFNDNDRVTYTPMITHDGRVGYKLDRPDGKVAYVYLHPSDSRACPTPDVFVYSGPSNDPALDTSHSFVGIDDETYAPEAQ